MISMLHSNQGIVKLEQIVENSRQAFFIDPLPLRFKIRNVSLMVVSVAGLSHRAKTLTKLSLKLQRYNLPQQLFQHNSPVLQKVLIGC
jgi:hypothetical protein